MRRRSVSINTWTSGSQRQPSRGCGRKATRDYEALLRLHIRPVLGTRPLGAIVQFDIQSIYARMFERGLSARTIEYTNAVLQSAFRQAVRWKMLAEDPCVGVDLPRMKRREMEALSVEECRRFLAVARETEWFALYALALTTGMRPSEYLALKWSDIDWHRGAASVCRTIQHSKAGLSLRRYEAKAQSPGRQASGFRAEGFGRVCGTPQLHAKEAGCQVEPDLIFRSGTGFTVETTERKARIPEASGSGWYTADPALRSTPHRSHLGCGRGRLGESHF